MKQKSKIEKVREHRRELKKQELLNEKRKLGLNQILKPALYLLISIILEITSFAIFKFKTTSGSTQFLPQYILFDVGVWLIVCGLMLCTKLNWLSNIIFYISLVLKATIFITNVTLRSDFGYLFSADKLSVVPEMVEAMNFSFINYGLILFCVLGAVVVISAPILFDKFFGRKKIQLKKISNSIFCLLFFLVTLTVGSGCFAAQTALLKTSNSYKEIYDDKYIYENHQINDLVYQKFGSCGFYLVSLSNIFFPNAGISKSEVNKTIETYNNSTVQKNESAKLYGDNLIVIMMESMEWFAIDPYNTPNLWALKTGTANENIPKQGMVFTNYISNNKTNVSENLCMLGYMPNEAKFNFKANNTYATKYSLANLFETEGYTTSYFHNWRINFFSRDKVNKEIGFDNIYSLEDFKHPEKSTEFNFYNRESDFIDQFMNKIAPTSGKFMSFYTTVSSHGTYDVQNPRFENHFKTYDSNLELMKELFSSQGYTYPSDAKFQARLKEYKSAIMDTDEMVGKLFKHLKDNNMLNTTNIVLYSDHNAYYEELTNHIKNTKKTEYTNTYSYTVPLMIYSNDLQLSTIDTFCSAYDLYPTICSLYGLPYNTYNAMGKDVLSADISNTVYYSALTGFYSPTCYSKNMQYIHKYENATDSDVDLFKTNVCEFLRKERTLSIVYKSNKTYK